MHCSVDPAIPKYHCSIILQSMVTYLNQYIQHWKELKLDAVYIFNTGKTITSAMDNDI